MGAAEERRRPGSNETRAPAVQLPDPNHASNLARLQRPTALSSASFVGLPDRWRLTKDLGLVEERWWDPYERNLFKADRPFHDDWFVDLGLVSDTQLKASHQATRQDAVGIRPVDIKRANLARDQWQFAETMLASATVFQGDTVYRPPEWQFKIALAANYSRKDFGINRVSRAARDAPDQIADTSLGLQHLSIRKHLRTVSANYDFDAIEFGIQPFNVDPRGFLLFDNALGARIFGTRAANSWRYAIAWSRRFEKTTDSGLNTLALRTEDIYSANVYRQDWPRPGLRSGLVVLHHRDREAGTMLDDNGFVVRPSVFAAGDGDIAVSYAGINIDGNIGFANLTAVLYKSFGEVQRRSGSDDDLDAWFFASELSKDIDWQRYRVSALIASGDGSPGDNKRKGFDSVFENPLFAGADTSVWIAQAPILLAGPRAGLSRRNGLLPTLRSPGPHGRANYTNPGLLLLGLGADFDVLPTLRVVANANRLFFHETGSLESTTGLTRVNRDIGWDLSAAIVVRPWFSQNAIIRISGGALLPGDGLAALVSNSTIYNVRANLVLRY